MCISIVDSEMPSIQNKGKEKLGKCFHFTLSFRITVISSSIFICRIAKLARWLENVKIQLYFCPSELGIVKWEAPTQFPPFLPERHKQVSLFSSRFFFFPQKHFRELCPPASVLWVQVCKREKWSRKVIFCPCSTDFSGVKELLLEELPSILWLPAENRCFMYPRMAIVVSPKH